MRDVIAFLLRALFRIAIRDNNHKATQTTNPATRSDFVGLFRYSRMNTARGFC